MYGTLYDPRIAYRRAIRPEWGSGLLREQENMVQTREFQARKLERIAAAKAALADAPTLPVYGQVIQQSGADGMTSYVHMTSCAPVYNASRWAALKPGPEGF